MTQEIKDIMINAIFEIAKLQKKWNDNAQLARSVDEYNYLMTAIDDCDKALYLLLSVKELKTAPIVAEGFNSSFLNTPVDIFSERIKNCLISGGIKEIGDLNNFPPSEVLKFRNMGKGSIKIIKSVLEAEGYSWDARGIKKIEQ